MNFLLVGEKVEPHATELGQAAEQVGSQGVKARV